MSAGSDHPATPIDSRHAGLLIVTGASHTGKTSVIRALLPVLHPPTALLAVDEVLEHTLIRPHRDSWSEIPLAYRLIQDQLDTLLDADWLVVIESTFTYVPQDGPPSFHGTVIDQIILAAEQREAPWVICQLKLSPEAALRRTRETGRLNPAIVAETVRLHDSAEMPSPTLRFPTENVSADRTAMALSRRLPPRFKR